MYGMTKRKILIRTKEYRNSSRLERSDIPHSKLNKESPLNADFKNINLLAN